MTEDRLPWFPCEPSALLGALAQMPPTEGYVYTIVLLRIYDCCGPCPDTLDAIARRTGYNKRIVTDALDKLFRADRLVRVAGGIYNRKAEHVIAAAKALRQERKVAGAEGGKRSAEKRKGNQTTPPSKPTGKTEQGSTHLHLQEQLQKVRKEGELPFATATGPTPPAIVKPKKSSGITLPADWMPSLAEFEYGERLGLSRAQVENFSEEMKLWAAGNSNRAVARKADWSATFKSWMRRENERRGAKNGIHRNGRDESFKLAPGEAAARYRARNQAESGR